MLQLRGLRTNKLLIGSQPADAALLRTIRVRQPTGQTEISASAVPVFLSSHPDCMLQLLGSDAVSGRLRLMVRVRFRRSWHRQPASAAHARLSEQTQNQELEIHEEQKRAAQGIRQGIVQKRTPAPRATAVK